MRTYYPTLTIAGSDSSGGAGIQADIKTMSAIGCYAMSAITSITAQNTTGVRSIMPVSPEVVADQIDMVMTDIPPLAIKVGMLCNAEAASAVAERLEHYRPQNLIVDPVMVSTSGSMLLEKDAVEVLTKRIFPLAELVTPNQMETKALTGSSDTAEQIESLRRLGCRNILIKGGDTDRTDIKVDILHLSATGETIELKADAVDTKNSHGTGCTLSSAIASYLALGYQLKEAVGMAKLYVTHALEAGSWITTGRGHGPVNHFFSPRRLKNFNPKTQQK
ncbi:MAG: bifunctional hydroxymethylpyrimidine kinase/phosphomethylpyrimidine kinase [Duncaniella sp.]|uniref:bifunctional hydroxymethylpyrimidine kinase/phosphomethylpyrimidine kinase n=1 Tax=Duncaniella sp. TaxID=2518496 RepID=UPI0023BFAA86|nr:bifunctional hydroxymethylpyrimidine kinase/phosphomethylpyrimidine kinase [Duncaniella sp.]MDE5989207.1 bifunctional hydroxymethylpyrimidine kinase/phosphomethylpyrimidine kinase [Duncaniella sp.]MDE6174326.1 bifunctional hydroxymethylpyrimidine kinase/phosphomethylpyrimidine kinase [Duncaniella sp.]